MFGRCLLHISAGVLAILNWGCVSLASPSGHIAA